VFSIPRGIRCAPPVTEKVQDVKLTEERAYILYKDILSAVSPNMSIKQIARSVGRGNNKTYSEDWIGRLLMEFERLGIVKRVLDEPKCVRYERTPKGERILKAETIYDIRRR
jgi:hypothetical protein